MSRQEARINLAREIYVEMAANAGGLSAVPQFLAKRALDFADAWIAFEDTIRFPPAPAPESDGTRVPSAP